MKDKSRLSLILASTILLSTGCVTTGYKSLPSPEELVQQDKNTYYNQIIEEKYKSGNFKFIGLGLIPYDD